MRTIFKTKLDVCDCQTVELPQDYKIVHVAMQQDTPCIWYECTPDMPTKKVEIFCFGTGYRMPDPGTPDGAIEHIGSVVTRDGFYVWHFYRKYQRIRIERIRNYGKYSRQTYSQAQNKYQQVRAFARFTQYDTQLSQPSPPLGV